jgi:ribosome assembly protein YihI (activator of Der GTPase)
MQEHQIIPDDMPQANCLDVFSPKENDMWLDGLTPDEIQSLLRIEGVFTPLLERIRNGDSAARSEMFSIWDAVFDRMDTLFDRMEIGDDTARDKLLSILDASIEMLKDPDGAEPSN